MLVTYDLESYELQSFEYHNVVERISGYHARVLQHECDHVNLKKPIFLNDYIESGKKDLKPIPQKGKPVNFKRRRKEQSSINDLNDIVKIYDYIRMLDAEGYPNAYLDFDDIRIEFSRAQLKADKSVIADVRIFKK